ncbi:MAG: TRAP-type mannitol/chloroaromatic compound transport system substrate-binding protein [Cognaticolwellia sp.]
MNEKAYNKLPKDLQKILTVAMKTASYDMYIQSYHESGKNLATLNKDYPNIKMRSFPESVMTAMKETNDALLKEFAAKDPMTAEILKSIADYQTKVRAWTNLSDRAYLDTTDPK